MSAQPGNRIPVIRDMRPVDLNAVTALEERSYSFPWSRRIFSDCLMAGYMSVVLESEDGIIGYAIVSVAAAEGHILNLCVDQAVRCSGYGRQLLEYILEYALERRIQRLEHTVTTPEFDWEKRLNSET